MNSTLGKITSTHPNLTDRVQSDNALREKEGNDKEKMFDPGNAPPYQSKTFFDVVTIDEAVRTVRSIAKQTGTETIMIDEADGRVLAESILTLEDIPGFNRSWKDGYAVVASDTHSTSESSPVILSLKGAIAMGKTDQGQIQPGECMYIPTGSQMPAGADAVVMIEYSQQVGEKVLIRQPVVVRENVIAKD